MVDGGSTGRVLVLSTVAECLGTGILLFFGCMGGVATLGVTPSHLQGCFTFGLVVLMVIQVNIYILIPPKEIFFKIRLDFKFVFKT